MPADRTRMLTLITAGTAGLFRYLHDGDFDEILEPGFFGNCASMLRQDDVIMAVGAEFGVRLLRVAEVGRHLVVLQQDAPVPAA